MTGDIVSIIWYMLSLIVLNYLHIICEVYRAFVLFLMKKISKINIKLMLYAMVAYKITNGCDNGSNCNNMILTVLPQIIEHAKVQWHMLIEIQVLAWDRHINVTELNRLMVSHPHLDKNKTDKHKQWKIWKDSLQLNMATHYHKN